MYRAVLTLLVGLMLSLGGGASALTFKSDGTVVQSDGTVVNSSDRPGEVPSLSKYDEFRVIDFDVAGKKYSTHTAFSQGKTLFGFKAKGVLLYQAEFCEWQSVIRNSKTKTGSFEAKCPSGAFVDGKFTFAGNHSGSYGAGIDNSGQKVSYRLKGRGSSSKAEVRKFFEQTRSFGEARRLYKKATDKSVCSAKGSDNLAKIEALRRGLSCGVSEAQPNTKVNVASKGGLYAERSDANVCQNYSISNLAKTEAKKRGLTCGASGPEIFTANNISRFRGWTDKSICQAATKGNNWETNPSYLPHVNEAKQRGLNCLVLEKVSPRPTKLGLYANRSDKNVCDNYSISNLAKAEAKRRGLSCDVDQSSRTQVANNSPTNAELLAAQKRASELEKQLALLQAKEELNQRQIASDNQAPLLKIIQSSANGREGYLTGSVADNVQVAEVLVDGAPVSVTEDGSFEWTGFVPATGKDIVVEAIDTAALSSRQIVRLERSQALQEGILRFDGLNPMSGKIAQANQNAIALIVGISEYDRTNAPAVFADNDAQFFQDYAALKLGISENSITTLVNGNAEQVDVLLSVKNWLSRAVKQKQSDVYIFFAGHGLASDDGKKMYLLPYDGAPELLDKTAILRDELFADIAAANPRSVTVFLDTCYSGTTRGPDMLIASRPIAIRAKEQAVPEGFTVMTAAAGDQTAKPLEEAKHGMFSYFLMKGMEGDADANSDNQITPGELHAYVQQNVIQQSSGSQTPELQGDAERVLVRFQ